jgi:hypothetical protein
LIALLVRRLHSSLQSPSALTKREAPLPADDPRPTPALAIFLGGIGGAPVEEWMRDVLERAALDAAEVALGSGAFERVLLLADREPAGATPAGLEVRRDVLGEAFHFGRAFAALASEVAPAPLAYLGGGSGPLLTAGHYTALVAPVQERDCCTTNNRFSSDLFALRDPSRVARLDPLPEHDNAIPRRLAEAQALEVVELPRTLETQFNIDTPSDALALGIAGRGGPRLATALARPTGAAAAERMRRAAREFIDRRSEVLVAGRVSSRTWQYLETETACRIRLLSEERGMHAAGTDAAGTARSLLGQWIALAGPERAFGELLPEMCRAAFVDLRPALVQLGLRPSRADRFAADLGLADQIEDRALRAIVEAANASPVPVVLGGHSLVGGCLELLNQWAWDEHDAEVAGT